MAGPPLHIRPDAAELFYVLEGTLLMKNGDEMQELAAGDTLYIPAGMPHTFTNPNETTAKALNLFCPGGFARFLEEIAESFAAAPPDEVDVNAIAQRHNQQLVGPPLAAMLRTNDTFTVSAKTPHWMYNESGDYGRLLWQVRPALKTQQFFETTWGLAADGKVGSNGTPNLLHLAVILRAYQDEFRASSPPFWIQRALFALLAPIGTTLGYQA